MSHLTFKHTRRTCFYNYLAMTSVFCLPPMLFMTFQEQYGISFTLLGTLVLINFCTQLTVDLIFSFFPRFFNIRTTAIVMPLLTSLGLSLYALIPWFFPDMAYLGLVIGTVTFSVAAGLSEVLTSPIIAALPSKNPDRDMSKLHSLYAYGVLTVVVISSIFLRLFGRENWPILTLLLALFPLISGVLFCLVPLPDLNTDSPVKKKDGTSRAKGMALFAACIFLGSCAENTMTNWISTFLETALGIDKTVGDILGLALFAVLLGLARTLYAKFGKNISKVLILSMSGAIGCYLVASLSPLPIISMLACVLTGFTTSMLWPGTLILMEETYPSPGVTAYALMAAAGDFGASIAPQLLGVVVDQISVSTFALALGNKLGLSGAQVGMKLGILGAVIFPILGVAVLIWIRRYLKKNPTKNPA